jgi:hypothetical protein
MRRIRSPFNTKKGKVDESFNMFLESMEMDDAEYEDMKNRKNHKVTNPDGFDEESGKYTYRITGESQSWIDYLQKYFKTAVIVGVDVGGMKGLKSGKKSKVVQVIDDPKTINDFYPDDHPFTADQYFVYSPDAYANSIVGVGESRMFKNKDYVIDSVVEALSKKLGTDVVVKNVELIAR